jgi:IclR family acetate operon transcriptional repressor
LHYANARRQVNSKPTAAAGAGAAADPPTTLRHIQSLERGMRLLKVIAGSPQPLNGVEVARRARINRSTGWRLLATLEQQGMVERDLNGLYQVGLQLFTLAAASPWGAITRRARPILESVSASTNETTALAVANSGGFEVLDQVDAPHALSVRWVGTRLPLLPTSVGKLILAALTDEQLERYLRQPIHPWTPRTVTDPAAIRAELDEVRRTGIGMSLGDHELGVNGVSAAARDAQSRPVAFISVTGPEVRLPETRIRQIAPLVRDAARRLETALGLSPPNQET